MRKNLEKWAKSQKPGKIAKRPEKWSELCCVNPVFVNQQIQLAGDNKTGFYKST